MRLKSKMLVPPGGWFFIEKGRKIAAPTYDKLVLALYDHRVSNGGDAHAAESDVQCQVCSRPECRGYCDEGGSGTWLQMATSFLDKAMQWMREGFPLVPDEVAEQRAVICSTCPKNQPSASIRVSGCGCGRKVSSVLDAAAQKTLAGINLAFIKMRGKKTSKDAVLQTCGICGCNNGISVWMPLKMFGYSPEEKERFEPLCWKKA